jgi:F-type H+-transporting ATPase subunit delta
MATFSGTFARAFADVVFEKKLDAARVTRELYGLVALLKESPDLRRVWENPSIPAPQKRAVLDRIAASETMLPAVRNFAAVLMDHRRIQFLEPIAQQFEHELNQKLGLVEAEVISARELGPDERQALEARVGKLVGKQIRARYRQDPSLLGGAVVRIGSTIYDGSVTGQLERVRQAISS